MPELPEVENYVRDLKPLLIGRRISAVHVFWPRSVDNLPPEAFVEGLAGRRFVHLDRRGKYMLFHLDSGQTLLLHLRMTGQLHVVTPEAQPDKHTHVVMALDDGRLLHYHDTRKFGRFYLVDDPQIVVGKLGPEPLSEAFTSTDLLAALAGRRAAIKTLLLDQRVVAGVGNIYADEVLFSAAIDPRRPGGSLSAAECSRLHAEIRHVLAEAIRQGGSTLGDSALNNYQRPVGVRGQYQDQHRVFQRTGEPCFVCGTPIERIRLSQRSTHFCPRCQRDFADRQAAVQETATGRRT